MKPISACLIVRNEERCLARCLSSLDSGWEKIVVDTGSTDKTIEIAKAHGAKVYHFEWIDDFSAARNFGLDKAQRAWIFQIDADEWLEPGIAGKINQLVKMDRFAAFEVLQISQQPGPLKQVICPSFRLFHNHPLIRFVFPGHEQVAYAIDKYCKDRGYENARAPEIRLQHDGYEGERGPAKTERAIPLIEKALEQYPDRSYLWAKYAQLMYQKKRSEDEFKALLKCVENLSKWKVLPEVEQGAVERFKILCEARGIKSPVPIPLLPRERVLNVRA